MSFRRRLMSGGKKKEYIKFEDPEVERICIANWSSDGVGLTYDDAERVTEINDTHGFKSNTTIVSFNELEFFTSLTHIKSYAFYNSHLKNIKLPKSIIYIGVSAFESSLCELTLDLPNLIELNDYCFRNSNILKVLNLGNIKKINNVVFGGSEKLEVLIIPNSVTDIGSYFANKTYNLIEVTMSNNLESIGVSAFEDSTSLMSIKLPGSLKTIGNDFCRNCSSLKNVIIEEGVSYLPYRCFTSTIMTKIVLPSTIQSLDEYSIANNSLLETVVIKSILPPTIFNNTFNNTPKLTNIYVPDESVEAYKAAENWSTWASKIKPLSEYVEN